MTNSCKISWVSERNREGVVLRSVSTVNPWGMKVKELTVKVVLELKVEFTHCLLNIKSFVRICLLQMKNCLGRGRMDPIVSKGFENY